MGFSFSGEIAAVPFSSDVEVKGPLNADFARNHSIAWYGRYRDDIMLIMD
jgi:hypothetical protein